MLKLSLIVIFLLYVSQTYSQDKWLFVTEPFPPYFSDQLPQQGWLADIVVSALASQDIEATIEFTTWARAIRLLEKNKRTALLGAYFSAEREKIFHYSRPLANSFTGLFKRKSSQINYDGNLTSLQPYSISKGSNYIVSDGFSSEHNLAITVTDDLISSLYVLQLGRVDLVAGTKQVGEYWLNNHPQLQAGQAIVYISPHLGSHHLYIIFAKSAAHSEQQLIQLENGLNTIINNGEAAQVLLRHGFSETSIEQYLQFLKR
ncbi:substrate-binding periplasmic protein [Pseudoalteromonas prydzensis]|uniref:substrate-binding periplasmic protein n=1 Tax=Pseudoalteromonas prydzensis TaxID=182141 RepID=UPI0026F1C23C|nr:transporter substrate-binding domain-containing protein [Pseudoalteromonas prydzensis]